MASEEASMLGDGMRKWPRLYGWWPPGKVKEEEEEEESRGEDGDGRVAMRDEGRGRTTE
jgi:hypothetical protein